MSREYTLSFVYFEDELILLNRQKSPWMGMWNGLGGKIEEDETAQEGAKRELFEELGVNIECELVGSLDWYEDNQYMGLLHITKSNLKERVSLPVTYEGILAYKKIDWIMHEENKGIAYNIKLFIEEMLEQNKDFYYTTYYENDQYIKTIKNR